ncbi:right-handed parallel beta-helix repeat-containing protein [Candidatus Albibeggiatoa sp. nov. NOAA]|uniref:right-handed parallel beta-helix repeat-containing protein n=1 Tax=Candidatus Albibeggiatoa sp. nov. NOAA TaxID=3162724 RepID=UPI0032F2DA82|nr:right-handed parallel beta-helix repeat-containing protein [Thiotrichaceae bacterium]
MNTTRFYYWGWEVNTDRPTSIQPYQFSTLFLILFIASVVGIVLPNTTQAATISVNTTDNESNSDGDCSLLEAIEAANTDAVVDACTSGSGDDTISLPDGIYETKDAAISTNVTIDGTSEAGTIIQFPTSDTAKKRVLKITSGATVNINDVTIQNGTSGNVYVDGTSTLNLTDASILNGTSSTDNGGGLKNFGTSVLTNVTLDGNSTTGNVGNGGAIYTLSSVTLDNVTITNNSTDRKGGGIFSAGSGSITIQNNSLIEDNTSVLCGAGIQTQSNTVTIANSTLQNNLYKSSSPSDFVTKSTFDISNVTSSYIGAFINSCYKSVFLLIDDYVEDTTDTIDITADDLDDALEGADDQGGTLDLTVDDNLLDGYKERIKEELDNDLSADTRNTNDTTTAGSSDADFEDAQDDLAALVDSVNGANDELGAIADANDLGATTHDALKDLLDDSGLKNVLADADNKTAYGNSLLPVTVTSASIDTTAELQALVDQANLDVISGYATGSDASDLSINQLGVDQLENVDSGNLALYQAAIAADSDGFADWDELQDLIDSVNALATIQDYADNNNANSLTISELTEAGVTGTVSANLDLYKTAIANADPSEVDTLAELQALIDSINNLADIQGYADSNDASSLAISDLTDGGITDTNAAYLADYQTAIEAADASDITSWDDVQDIIDQVNEDNSLNTIQAYANAENASAMTMDELEAGGLDGLNAAYLADYQAAIAAAGIGSISSWADVQAIIDQVNALKKIQEAADSDDASDISIDDLNKGDLTDVDSGNLSEYQDEIAASNESDVQTWDDVQEIIDRVNEEVANNEETTSEEENSTESSGSVYYPADHYLLTISSPRGRAYTSPAGIDCDHGNGTCQKVFPRGTKVTLHTEAKAGSIFDGWSGSLSCKKASLVMNKAHTCTATFHGDPNYVPPTDNDSGSGDGTAGTDGDGTGTGSNNPVYVDSFSIRAKIQGKNACYQHANPHPDDVVVAGFILEGAGTEQVLIRALDLEQGVNPKVLVKQTILGSDGILRGVPVAKNDAWALHGSSLDIPEFHQPENQTDAALLLDLPAGAYTVTMCMSPNSEADSGVGLVSVMLLDNTLTFGNVSGRGYVSGGANDAIIGFSVFGADGRKTAHIKGSALSESLDTQIDSSIEIGRIYFDSQTNQVMGSRMANVSSWREENSINHLPLHTELEETDAAISMSFNPGSYTTILSSESGVPGLGIISIEFVD